MRLLLQSSSSPINIPPPPPSSSSTAEPVPVDSDVVVILAALLCALICVVGLALVARCAWLRRASSTSPTSPATPPPACSKGLKKKTIRSLPKLIFTSTSATSSSTSSSSKLSMVDCAICLAEFTEGDEVRVLPQCGHGFHVGCVDTWLASNSSCPSCRHVLVFTRCEKCGASSQQDGGDDDDLEQQGGAGKVSQDRDVIGNSFLP